MIDLRLIEQCELELNSQFKYHEEIALYNQEKVLNAFKEQRLALRHFSSTSGYGYGDIGRDAIENIFSFVLACLEYILYLFFFQ